MGEKIAPDAGPGRNTEPELDRIPRFSQRVSVSTRCVQNWLHDRRIPFLKVGKTVLIPWREALEKLKRDYQINARDD